MRESVTLSIDVDLRELEAYIAGEIQRSFDTCPMELLSAGKDRAQAGVILAVQNGSAHAKAARARRAARRSSGRYKERRPERVHIIWKA